MLSPAPSAYLFPTQMRGLFQIRALQVVSPLEIIGTDAPATTGCL
jgi:hypothetical protein